MKSGGGICYIGLSEESPDWFNIKMSDQYMNFYCGDIDHDTISTAKCISIVLEM